MVLFSYACDADEDAVWEDPRLGDIIVDGGTSPRDIASTIVDLSDESARWKVIREGEIASDEISKFFAQG